MIKSKTISLLTKTNHKLKPFFQFNFNNLRFQTSMLQTRFHYHFSQDKQSRKIITTINKNQVLWDFSLLDQENCQIDCILIQNNIVINLPWLQKSISRTKNIVLADGGANVFYQSGLGNHQKVKAIVGDLDSLKKNVLQFYQSRGVEIHKMQDQNKNDFQKAVEWIVQKGWKNVFAFGSFGGRMDHTLATISNAEKLTKKFADLEILLIGKINFMCILRGGKKHTVKISKNINKKGCGIITFNKVQQIETTGFRWNLGRNHSFHSLEWGNFLSTSNQIIDDEITIQTFDQNDHIKFVTTFVDQPF